MNDCVVVDEVQLSKAARDVARSAASGQGWQVRRGSMTWAPVRCGDENVVANVGRAELAKAKDYETNK